MTPAEVQAYRQRLGLTQSQLGEALGLADPGRVVRAWESGFRGKKPYQPSGSAVAAMRYFEAIIGAEELLTVGESEGALKLLRRALI